jgi:plasmid stability protein
MAHIQIRNVPPDIHKTMKERAAKAGMSLQEYILAEITDSASLPTLEELTTRIRRRGAAQTRTDPADIIRQDRDSR